MNVPKAAQMIGKLEIAGELEKSVRAQADRYPTARIAVYECHALGDPNCGRTLFLSVGPNQTYKEPPEFCPGDHVWMKISVFVGFLDFTKNPIGLVTE